jgi:hypothetical protein
MASRYRQRRPKRCTSDVASDGIRCSAEAIGVSITVRTEQRRQDRSSDAITRALWTAMAYSESVKITAPAVPPESAMT